MLHIPCVGVSFRKRLQEKLNKKALIDGKFYINTKNNHKMLAYFKIFSLTKRIVFIVRYNRPTITTTVCVNVKPT